MLSVRQRRGVGDDINKALNVAIDIKECDQGINIVIDDDKVICADCKVDEDCTGDPVFYCAADNKCRFIWWFKVILVLIVLLIVVGVIVCLIRCLCCK